MKSMYESTDKQTGIAGAVIEPGRMLFIDRDNLLKPYVTQLNDLKKCVGIALHFANPGEPLEYGTQGTVIRLF